MKKSFLIIFCFLLLFLPFSCYCLEYPALDSSSVIVFDRTDNNVLYSVNSEVVTSIASLTKIVTTIVSIEKIDDLDEKVVITSSIINSVDPVASKAGLKVGDIVIYRDLLYASILPSGADATNALAISLSGSIDNFVLEMNDFVIKLGLKNTHFVNVTGLDADGHYSSANDVLKILNYSLNNSLFYDVFTAKKYTLTNGLEVKSTLYKYNGDDVGNIIGSKTGYTGNAGYCIATLSKTDEHDIIVVLLNASHKDGRYYNIVDSVNLIDFINSNYSNVLLLSKGSKIISLPVNLSKTSTYDVESKTDIYKFLPKDFDTNSFSFEYSGLNELSYKNNKGDKIGEISYIYNDNVIYKEDVILNKSFEISYKKIFIKYLFYEVVVFLSIVIIFITSIIYLKNNKRAIK